MPNESFIIFVLNFIKHHTLVFNLMFKEIWDLYFVVKVPTRVLVVGGRIVVRGMCRPAVEPFSRHLGTPGPYNAHQAQAFEIRAQVCSRSRLEASLQMLESQGGLR